MTTKINSNEKSQKEMQMLTINNDIVENKGSFLSNSKEIDIQSFILLVQNCVVNIL